MRYYDSLSEEVKDRLYELTLDLIENLSKTKTNNNISCIIKYLKSEKNNIQSKIEELNSYMKEEIKQNIHGKDKIELKEILDQYKIEDKCNNKEIVLYVEEYIDFLERNNCTWNKRKSIIFQFLSLQLINII